MWIMATGWPSMKRTKMKIVRYPIKKVPPMDLETFADNNGLVLEIHEVENPAGFHVYFKDLIIKGRSLRYGRGATEIGAVKDYISKISEQDLVYMAGSENFEREFTAPRITPDGIEKLLKHS